jgi:uncharacterized membrane protein YvbJ
MTNFCDKCGNGLTADAKFCASCGKPVVPATQIQLEVDEKADKKKAWGKWLVIFIPAFIVAKLAIAEYGFDAVFPILIAILIAILLYQRYYKQRSWHSILWGKEKK